MTIGLKGLYTPPAPEDRDIAYLEVVYNGQTYDWLAFVPRGQDIAQSIFNIEASVYADIDRKEAAWTALDPKTRTETDPITEEQTEVPILKEEIVKPDNPDYYALRRAEYPPVSDQLDAYWKGSNSSDYLNMLDKISAVKIKYPSEPLTFTDLKNLKLNELANKRWRTETGGITYNGMTLATDSVSQTKYVGAVVGAQLDPTVVVNWKMADGSFVELDATGITAVAIAVRSHIQACFDIEAQYKELIELAVDKEDLDLIDITVGWPS